MDKQRDKLTDGEALAAAETFEAQRRNWVVGDLMLRHPTMTRAEAETLVDAAARRLADGDP